MGLLSRFKQQFNHSQPGPAPTAGDVEDSNTATSSASARVAERSEVSILAVGRLRGLDRIGREHYGHDAGAARQVEPSGATLLLEAAAAMGIAFPTPASDAWAEYERRLCHDLLWAAETYGGWTIAGALYVALDLDSASQSDHYLAILDQAAEFLQSNSVPASHVSPFVVERRNANARRLATAVAP